MVGGRALWGKLSCSQGIPDKFLHPQMSQETAKGTEESGCNEAQVAERGTRARETGVQASNLRSLINFKML